MNEGVKDTLRTFATFCWYIMMPCGAAIYFFDQALFTVFRENPVFIWVGLVAIFNAIMDCVENEHIFSTIFRRLEPSSFWYKRDSWNKAKRLFGYKFDSWHLAKSANIICWVLACLAYAKSGSMFGDVYDFLLLGGWWNLVFNGFYNKVFGRKKRL